MAATSANGVCCDVKSPSWGPANACMGIDEYGPFLSLDTGMYGKYKLLARGDPDSFLMAKIDENVACSSSSSAKLIEMLNATVG